MQLKETVDEFPWETEQNWVKQGGISAWLDW